jgi:5-methylcytosine-specific restriction endonuclease McrA
MMSDAPTGFTRDLCNGNICTLERYQPPVPVRVSCEVCGSVFDVGRRKKYCSANCYLEANRRQALQKAELMRSLRPETKLQTCGWCSEVIEVPSSYTGTKVYHDVCRKQATRHRNRKKTVKRQGAKTVERIDIFLLAERDNFVCHICLGLVDMSVSRVSRFGATVDHVMPISKGGLDTLDNVRLAHWICNIRKSNSLEFVNGESW